MTTFEILSLFVGSGLILSTLSGVFRIGKMAQKIDTMQADIGEIKTLVSNIDSRLIRVETKIEGADQRLARLEGEDSFSKAVLIELVKKDK